MCGPRTHQHHHGAGCQAHQDPDACGPRGGCSPGAPALLHDAALISTQSNGVEGGCRARRGGLWGRPLGRARTRQGPYQPEGISWASADSRFKDMSLTVFQEKNTPDHKVSTRTTRIGLRTLQRFGNEETEHGLDWGGRTCERPPTSLSRPGPARTRGPGSSTRRLHRLQVLHGDVKEERPRIRSWKARARVGCDPQL